METSEKTKIAATSIVLAFGCAAVTFAILKFKNRLRQAASVFKYLTIQNITTKSSCDNIVTELRMRCSSHRAIGFDCEWVTEHGKRHPVALVQLSSFDGLCGLFRINQLGDIPESLKALLEDENIYKVGVAPADDARYLHSDYGVTLHSGLDIRHIALLCGYNPGGLATLAKSQLHIIMDKSWRIRCSDWEAPILDDRQQKYAAIDAHVAIRIFVKLINELNGRGFGISKWWPGKKDGDWSNIDDICRKYTDVSFKGKNVTADKSKSKAVKEVVLNKKYPYSTRSKPLYHNCFLEAPDGDLLCTCDNKKALWYVQKQLADIVQEEPLTVRLRFEPAGRSVGDVGRYYQLTKLNQCVVCGATESYIRKNVVPREYRRNLPDIMKEHTSHDVLLLCTGCHQRSNLQDQALRARLAAICDAPVESGLNNKYSDDATAKKIRSAARALVYQSKKHVLPEERRLKLLLILKGYYNCDEITEELLIEAAHAPTAVENTDYEAHGVKVVKHYAQTEGGLLRLEEMWREHFFASMRPKYMPELWSLNHNEQRLWVRWEEGRISEEEMRMLGLTNKSKYYSMK